LAAEEKEINEHNQEFLAGKSTFAEELNKFSDIPENIFEEDMEGIYVFPQRYCNNSILDKFIFHKLIKMF
jgi:hypothetical protein